MRKRETIDNFIRKKKHLSQLSPPIPCPFEQSLHSSLNLTSIKESPHLSRPKNNPEYI
jgi:hypothetical protein